MRLVATRTLKMLCTDCATSRSRYGKQLADQGYDRKEFLLCAEETEVDKLLAALKIEVPAAAGAETSGTDGKHTAGKDTRKPMPTPHRRKFKTAWKEEAMKLKQKQSEAPDTEPRERFLETFLSAEHDKSAKDKKGKTFTRWALTFKYQCYKQRDLADTERTIYKRYSEVKAFHEQLQVAVQAKNDTQAELAARHAAQELPPLVVPKDIPLPPTGNCTTDKQLEERKRAFETYFTGLIRWEQSQKQRGHDRACDVAWLQVLDVAAAFFNFEDPQAASTSTGNGSGRLLDSAMGLAKDAATQKAGDLGAKVLGGLKEPEPEPEHTR